ncbi:MAG: response regulator [Thermoplasmata archaeon]
MRLLLVDDDAVIREELGELLRDDGHEVRDAPSVPKAIEILEKEAIDLVLTDLKMPRHGGLELLAEVRRRWPDVLVVVVTGYATVETAVEAMKLGAFDYVRKPFRFEQVRSMLDLAAQAIQFHGDGGRAQDIDRTLEAWTTADGLDVLHLTDRAVRPRPRVTVVSTGLDQPAEIQAHLDSFLVSRPHAGVILERADRLFQAHRRLEVLQFIERLKEELEGRGPLMVTFDPSAIAAADMVDLRARILAETTRATLEALSNPLRRSILRRASLGPCSFTEAMSAAGIDETPKVSFHLHRLEEDGLLVHSGDDYRITPRGREAMALLADMDAIATRGLSGNRVLAVGPG